MKKILTFLAIIPLLLLSSTASAIAQTAPPVENRLSVSASIQPQQADFQFLFRADKQGKIAQGKQILYEIEYGASSSAAFATNTTITVTFSGEKAPDGTNIVQYDIGSATKGYGNTSPVVDMANRTITWTILNLPAGTMHQKVSFKLVTNGQYVGEAIGFTTTATMSNQFLTLPQRTLHHLYQFDKNLITTAPTATPAEAITPIPTVTPNLQPVPLRIQDIYITSITATTASIATITNKPAKLTLRYGTSPEKLIFTKQLSSYAVNGNSTLDELLPETQYFFRVTAIDSSNQTTQSDILTFTTAKDVALPNLLDNAFFLSSGTTTILSDVFTGGAVPFGILTTDLDYLLTYTFKTPLEITGIEALVRNHNGNNDRNITMTSHDNRFYTAQLHSGDIGMYALFVRIRTRDGLVIEQKVADVRIMNKLKVVEENTMLPIAGARVLITDTSGIQTPYHTNTSGEITALLQQGSYKAEASAIGYDGKTLTFTIGQSQENELPVLQLHPNFWNIQAAFVFMQDWLGDLYKQITEQTKNLTQSLQAFHSTAYTILLSFIVSSVALFTIRTNIRLIDIVPFFVFNMLFLVRKHRSAYLYGEIVTNDNTPVNGARVEVLDIKNASVIAHTLTNRAGKFIIPNTFKQLAVNLQVSKEGYVSAEKLIQSDTKDLIRIQLFHHAVHEPAIIRGAHHMVAELFELILLLSLVAELLFLFSFGILRTLPFFALSVFNLLLWLFYLKESKR